MMMVYIVEMSSGIVFSVCDTQYSTSHNHAEANITMNVKSTTMTGISIF